MFHKPGCCFSFFRFLSIGFLFISVNALGRSLPVRPTAPDHPGSAVYVSDSVSEISEPWQDRKGTLYLPENSSSKTFTTFAFGHGHSVPEFTYAETFRHLAKKGIAVLYVPYDLNSSDRDFDRMARDYNQFVAYVINRHKDILSPDKVVFSGHSNGATVALMAAGLPTAERRINATEVLTFAVAGNHPTYYTALDKNMPCTLVVGQSDTEDPPEFSRKIVDTVTCKKQMIILSSYLSDFDDQVVADHGSIRNIGWLGVQTSVLHYYGYWKFMMGAVLDVNDGAQATNPWLFGDAAADTGDKQLRNQIFKFNDGSSKIMKK